MQNQMVRGAEAASSARAADRLVRRTDSLAPQIKNTGERPRWSPMDAYILVHKYVATAMSGMFFRASHVIYRVDSMNVRDDTEIDWKLLPDENWNIWSAHSLQRRWLTMKRSIKGFEEMSHAGESGFWIILQDVTRLISMILILQRSWRS